ncbi:MAG: ParB/RepB/Spo0J family partition protein [Clostridiales bacterium]|nr:ParB/RepB/Spo0J family partition protein [Clostridiales bacterium]
MKKNALGRGLDALMPQADYENSVQEIAIDLVDINPGQPRKKFDQDALQQLADSIAQVGLLQPILVMRKGGRFAIIAGERRYRACRLAGLKTIPIIEKTYTGEESMLAALVENLQREDLNRMEEAAAIRELMDVTGFTQEEAAKRLGKSRSAVANVLRLLNLPPLIQEMLRNNLISEGHARVLASVKDLEWKLQLAQITIDEGLSVRALEARVHKPLKATAPQAPPRLAPELDDFARRLQRLTGVRTKITGDLQQGKLTLVYKSAEELESLYQALEGLLP